MHNNRNLDQSSAHVPALTPLEAIEAAFLSLARGIRPVALPAALLADHPTSNGAGRAVPVGQVRARLVHPSCRCGCWKVHPCWSCGMSVLVEGSAESVVASYV
jgi:hypothetical protein